jgi:hypothetical protein
MSLVRGIYNQHLLVKRSCSRGSRGGRSCTKERPQEPGTTAARRGQNAVGDDGGRAPGTSQSWCCNGWTRSNAATPGTAGSPAVAGRSRPPQSRTHPRLAEHRRREERKYIDDRVPPKLAQLILRFDSGILVDRTWGEVAGWCAAKAANVLGLNMVHELVTGKPSVKEARHLGAEHRGLQPGPRRAVCRAAAVPGSRRAAPTTSMGASSLQRCSSRWPGRRKDAVTGGEEATDCRTRAAARRAGWGGNLARNSDPPAWLRFHGPRLISASSLKGAGLG